MLQEVGERIRIARTAANLTQEAAADRSAIDYKRWQRLEQGTVNPTVKTLERVSKALGISFWKLMGR